MRTSLALVALFGGIAIRWAPVAADCSSSPLGGHPLPNVLWSLKDSVSACPGGDSLTLTGRPSALRVRVLYDDANCNANVGVPPESIYLTTMILSGNLRINDVGTRILADSATNYAGLTRFTIRSFSGGGKVRLFLTVSGDPQGHLDALVRSTDTDADGRVTDADSSTPFDLDFDGVIGIPDQAEVIVSKPHFHRNSLHGEPVQWYSACPTCQPNGPRQLGDGDITWSPTGKYLALSVRDTNSDCHIYLLRTDTRTSGTLIPFSHPPVSIHDYDPNWSSLNNVIVWDRDDDTLYTKGVPDHNPDTTSHVIPVTSNLIIKTEPSLSPDGSTIAFSGYLSGASSNIYTVPITGGTPTQVTDSGQHFDHYPKWSPDGSTIIFYRFAEGPTQVLTVPAFNGSTS